MDGDFLNSFAETFEITSLLSDLTETSDEKADNATPITTGDIHEATVSQLFSARVNWKNASRNGGAEPLSVNSGALVLDEIPEKSVSELFQSINWTNIRAETEVSLEVEEAYTVDAMFDGFNW
ncbi:MAG: hypothetical protein P1V97_21370 [Planctomycetota bacterium]|nr:hypothetical protein [Planctomycetota bacterium]